MQLRTKEACLLGSRLMLSLSECDKLFQKPHRPFGLLPVSQSERVWLILAFG